MKKFYYSLFAAATMLLATTSCSQDEDILQQGSSDVTTFKVDLQGAVGSRAAGDGLTVDNLYYEVYHGTNKVLDNFGTDKNAEPVTFNEKGQATVTMPLMKGENYDIIFWAQKGEGSIYNADDLKNIQVSYNESTKANKEAYDAFFNALPGFKATSNVTTVQLRRPFAQLNIGTIDTDWAKAKTMISGTDAPVTKSQVTVTGLASSFNALTGSAFSTEGEVDVTFYANDLLTVTNEAGVTDVETFYVTTKDAEGNDVTKTYYNLAMNYLLVPGEKDPQGEGLDTHKPATETEVIKTNANVTAKFWRGTKELFELNIPNVTIQRNYRTNIYGTLLAAEKKFEIEIAPIFDGDHNYDHSTVDLDLEAALKQDKEHIVIDLAASGRAVGRTYNVNIGAAQVKYYFGGEKTKTITINANGNTINFIHNNTDWNYIRCVNDDTKWTINDAHLTNSSGASNSNKTGNDGPWNRHNIRFYNAVELNNVTSDKAIALLNDGKLEGVKISDVHPKNGQAYGLWVASYGQTVELNNCEIVSHSSKLKDLGITINDQYTNEGLAKSTLIVKNTKFVTQDGPAIMVESTAGANIILENNDISGTKDGFNAVWMEKSRKEYFNEVSVEGGTAIIQGEEPAENPFMIEGNTVKVAKGVYGTLPKMANGVTIEAEEGTVFTGISGVSGEGVTIKNVRFSNTTTPGQDGEIYALSGTLNGTIFENCQFDALSGARWCYAKGNVVFTDCTFGSETSKRGVHFDSGDGYVTFKNCDFYSFNALGYSIKNYKFNECDIKVSSNAHNGFNGVNMYGTMYEYTNCTFEPDTYTDCASDNVTATYTDCSYTDNSLITSVIRFDKDASTCTVTFDGKQINFINKAASIAQAADNSELYLVNGTYDMPSLSGKTIALIGQSKEKTILNMLKTGGNNPQYTAKSITYKNLTVNRPTKTYQGVNAESESFENCILKGLQFLYSNKITYTNCDFDANGAEHCSWTYGAEEVNFTGCTFTYSDRGINCYSDQKSQATKAIFTDCIFTKVAGKETTGAIETNSSIMTGLELYINNCFVNEGKLWFIPIWDSLFGEKTKVFVNDEEVKTTEILYGAGTFSIPNNVADKTITFEGIGDATVFDFTKAYNVNGASITFKNLKIEGKNANVMNGYGIQHTTGNIKYENCTLNNAITNEFSGNVEYDGCTFTGTYYIATYSVKSATFTGCTFDREDSRAVLVYSHGDNPVKVSLDGCTFKAKAKGYTGVPAWTAAVEVDTTNIPSEGTTVTVTDCTADENYNGLVRDKSAVGKANAVITIDGNPYSQNI